MKKSVYDTGIFNATTIKYPTTVRQIVTKIMVSTPKANTEFARTETIEAIWDTGATGSCISKKYAEALGLKPIDYGYTYGISGGGRTPIYEVIVNLNEYVKNIPVRVTEVKLHKDDGGPEHSEIGFLIGMDIISLGDFFVGGYKDASDHACSLYSFRIPSAYAPVDYLKEVKAYNKMSQIKLQQENRRNFLNKKRK